MSYTPEEVAQARAFAEELKITADVDPRDGKTLCFIRTPEIPESFNDEIKSTLDLCIEYHQRSVFTGEYLSIDPNPPDYRSASNPLDEINFFLNHYKDEFLKEVDKGLDLNEDIYDDKRPKRKMTPFAKIMMKHQAQQRKKKRSNNR